MMMMMRLRALLAFAVCANFAADAFSYHGSEECPSPPKVSVITDAVTSDGVLNDASKFWTLWREGAAAAAAEVDFRGFYKIELQSIDVQAYVDGIASACETADAIVVSVPFDAGTPDYAAADAAINDCLDSRPDLPMFSTAYDTYKNDRLYGYVGAENFAVGCKCARALLFTDEDPQHEPAANRDAVTGRGPPLAEPVAAAARRCPDGVCQIYWPASLAANAGIGRLVAGINHTLQEYGFVAEVIRSTLEEELSLFDPTTWRLDFMRILTGQVKVWQEFANISSGFTTLVSGVGMEFFPTYAKLACGTVNPDDENAWQIGASAFRQGLTAVNSAAAAARLAAEGREWRSAKGNNEALEVSESLTNVDAVYVPQISAAQLAGAAGLGFDEHEKYMRLAVATSFFSYASGRVGGGSVRDVYDNTCWTDGFESIYGKPLGKLHQFYYESGDNLAYVVHLKEAGGDDIVAVNFRGTQGPSALTNWMVNADMAKKEFPCPGLACRDTNYGAADPYGDGCAEYNSYPGWCGNYDDSDFTSNDMCCICGGGAEAAAHLPEGFTCMVHSGFRESYEGLVNVGLVTELEALLADITAVGGTPKVLVAGHSLGGAMATVAAYDFALERGIDVFGLYTQGSPRVFETLTRNYLESLRTFAVWRSTFGDDPVVRIPFDSIGFQHVGVEVHGDGAYDGGYGTLASQDVGDGTGQDNDLTYNKGVFQTEISDHGPGASYFLMHDSTVATDASGPCVGETYSPKDYGYGSCEAKCLAKTGSTSHEYHGNGYLGGDCWELGYGGDCDYRCNDGYCTFAPERFSDYPNGWWDWGCSDTTGRICCCSEFQTSEIIHT